MRKLLLFAGLVALPLTAMPNASATEPTRTTVVLHRHIDPFFLCDGFAVIGDFDVTRDITTFYDADGTPIAQTWVATITGTVTNKTTGSSLPTSGVRVFHIDLVDGSQFTTGTNNFTKLPDGGVAIGGAGRLVFDAAGNLIEHDGPDMTTERAQLCTALA